MAVRREKNLTANFRSSEFRCKCRSVSCDAPAMRDAFMAKLQALRDLFGAPLVISSGARCLYWNKLKGGEPKSQHTLGNAADIAFENPEYGRILHLLAQKVGMGGIGLGHNFIHVDDGPPNRRWAYDTAGHVISYWGSWAQKEVERHG